MHDYPWGYCMTCTAVLIDLSREPEDRLNPPYVLDAFVAKMQRYANG